MLTCLCRACTFAAWRMCKRSSPGDTPAHVLVSHSWPHFRGASDPPSCEPPHQGARMLTCLCRACTFAAWRMCKRSSPGDTPAHVLVSHSWPHFRGASDPPSCEPPHQGARMLTCLCRACTFAAWRMCKRSSPGDTPAHVLVSHSWPHYSWG